MYRTSPGYQERECKSSGATKHTKECHGQFYWLLTKTVCISPYIHERKNREVLEINKLKTINEKDKSLSFELG